MNVNDAIVAGIRLHTLLTAAGVALAAALFNVTLRWWLTRRSAAGDAPGTEAAVAGRVRWWVTRGVHAVMPPVGVIVWIHAFYVICDLLLAETSVTVLALRGRPALGWMYGVAMVAALVWLLSRIGGVIERFMTSLSGHTDNTWDDVMLPLVGSAARRLLPLLALILAAPALAVSPALETMFRNGASLLLIGAVAF
ncbi:MAG: hypothetical protein IT183_07000, partial [Acidobacteria bacterium]|nr:hypothetical protein [Acidobacteriota bacterium]